MIHIVCRVTEFVYQKGGFNNNKKLSSHSDSRICCRPSIFPVDKESLLNVTNEFMDSVQYYESILLLVSNRESPAVQRH